MPTLIRHAGLRPEQEQRLRFAVAALSASGIQASLDHWDGTRCKLVVVNLDDGHGRKVREIAQRRGLRVVGWAQPEGTDGHTGNGRNDLGVADLTRWLESQLRSEADVQPGMMATSPSMPASNSGLVRLAQDPACVEGDIEARLGGRHLYLLRSSGRVLTSSLSDQMAARDRLHEAGWSLRQATPSVQELGTFEYSGSLDAWLLSAALRKPEALPAFPEKLCFLEHWPDLGASPDAIGALKVARALGSGATPSSIVARHVLDPWYVAACLWAFAAAGLLRARSMLPKTEPTPEQGRPARLLNKLASYFGLGRQA